MSRLQGTPCQLAHRRCRRLNCEAENELRNVPHCDPELAVNDAELAVIGSESAVTHADLLLVQRLHAQPPGCLAQARFARASRAASSRSSHFVLQFGARVELGSDVAFMICSAVRQLGLSDGKHLHALNQTKQPQANEPKFRCAFSNRQNCAPKCVRDVDLRSVLRNVTPQFRLFVSSPSDNKSTNNFRACTP